MTPPYKLVAFDVNGVFTDCHTIIDLANFVGTRDKVHSAISKHKSGLMNLSHALMEACRHLRGLRKSHVEEYSWNFPLMDGARETVEILRKHGIILAFITTGFTITMEILNKRLGNHFKYIIANELLFDEEGVANGGIRFSVMENKSKADRLRELVEYEGLTLDQAVGVGDSAGDIHMLKAAGLGIAFNPNQTLEDFAKTQEHVRIVKEKDLRLILPHILSKN